MTSNPSWFRNWVKAHEHGLAIAGVVILLATYVSKDILQSRLEARVREINDFFVENRLSNEVRTLRSNLRSELSRGTDAKKRYQDQDASLLVNQWKGGGYAIPFGGLVDGIECKDDQQCRMAEWFRYEQELRDSIDANARFAEVVGEPPLDQTKQEMERLTKLSSDALAEAENYPNLPDKAKVDVYIGHISALDSAVNARRDALMFHAAEAISATRWELATISVLSGVLYLAGWSLTLVGRLYGVGTSASTG